jgi:hypothetical protein
MCDHHELKGPRVVVTVDDSTALGMSKSLNWFRGFVQRMIDVKFTWRLERGKPRAVKRLSRTVTMAEHGLECNADQRHAEILIKDMSINDA